MLRFTCEKALFQAAIAAAGRAVSSKTTIPALEGILIEGSSGITLSGFNMSTGIRTRFDADIQEQGSIVINARLLGDIVRRMPDDVLVFSADERYNVSLKCGDASFSIIGLSANDYPELPEVDDEYSVVLRQGQLKEMIDQTIFAVSTNESRPVHTGALFEINDQGLTVVAVDGFRLALRREPVEKIEGGAFRFVAPGAALKEVSNICDISDDNMEIISGKRHLLFEIGDTELICRRLEGEFLDYKNAIPRNNPIRVEVETRSMLESLDRVSVVISEKQKSPVRCRFDLDRVYLSAKTGIGDASDVCAVKGDGRDMEIGFNNRYMMEALRNCPEDKVIFELNTGISPCVIVPAEDSKWDFTYMVLPVRLKAQ